MAIYTVGVELDDFDSDILIKELIAFLGYAAGSWDVVIISGVSVEFIKIDPEIDDSEVDALILLHGAMPDCQYRCAERRCKEVDFLRNTKYNTPMSYGGTTWQVDGKAQASIQFRHSYSSDNLLAPLLDPPLDFPWADGYVTWRDALNNDVVFTGPEDFIAFAKAVSDHCNTIFAQSTAHKDALRVIGADPLQTIADIEAYDITGGW